MPRVFVSPENITASRITIDEPSTVHHLQTVLRVAVGDRLTCVDGCGREYEGAVVACDARHLTLRVEASRPSVEVGPSLWLAHGIPKGARFDWAIEKATELGAARIVPLLTRHTVVRMTVAGSASKVARWQRLAAAAARQCHRAVIPAIDSPQSFHAFLAMLPLESVILMPTLQIAAPSLSDTLKRLSRAVAGPAAPCREASEHPIILLIGPEGDFSKEEVALAQAHGAQPVSLGSLTFRSETAAIATLAMVRYAFGCP